MKFLRVTYEDGVAVVKLDRGVTNALNGELLRELSKTMRMLRYDKVCSALVLTSTNEKFFSIGFDIPELFPLDADDFLEFYRGFNRVCSELYTYPKPTIASIPGHAVAGGCILALCCDYRFIAEGRNLMGLNEIKLGVPLPYLVDCILHSIVGTRNARDMADSGDFYEPDKLLALGVVDAVLPAEQLLAESVAHAGSIGSHPREAFAAIKRNRVQAVRAQASRRAKEKERQFVDMWYASETRQRLKEAMERY
jgi:enoyl-CoA hydratase/carnithine racemase